MGICVLFGDSNSQLIPHQVVHVCMFQIPKGFIRKMVVGKEPRVPVVLAPFVIFAPLVRELRYKMDIVSR